MAGRQIIEPKNVNNATETRRLRGNHGENTILLFTKKRKYINSFLNVKEGVLIQEKPLCLCIYVADCFF
jgi:hypothetical protein